MGNFMASPGALHLSSRGAAMVAPGEILERRRVSDLLARHDRADHAPHDPGAVDEVRRWLAWIEAAGAPKRARSAFTFLERQAST